MREGCRDVIKRLYKDREVQRQTSIRIKYRDIFQTQKSGILDKHNPGEISYIRYRRIGKYMGDFKLLDENASPKLGLAFSSSIIPGITRSL